MVISARQEAARRASAGLAVVNSREYTNSRRFKRRLRWPLIDSPYGKPRKMANAELQFFKRVRFHGDCALPWPFCGALQAGLFKILQTIYEQGFNVDAYGLRPKRSWHDAPRALSEAVEANPVHYIVEADTKGFSPCGPETTTCYLSNRGQADTQVHCKCSAW
jgi:hypothetical protein